MFFAANVAFSSTPVFLPSILASMGHTALTAQLLTAPPYLVAFGAVLLTAWLSDRQRARGWYVMLHSGLGAAGYAGTFTLLALPLPMLS